MTEYRYDSNGYARLTRNHLGHVEQFAYEPTLGVLAAHLDADGVLHTYRYDGFGRPLGSASPTDSTGTAWRENQSSLTRRRRISIRRQRTRTTGRGTGPERNNHSPRQARRERWRSEAMPQGRHRYVWQKYDALGRHVGSSSPRFTPAEPTSGVSRTDYDLAATDLPPCTTPRDVFSRSAHIPACRRPPPTGG